MENIIMSLANISMDEYINNLICKVNNIIQKQLANDNNC